MRVDGCDWSYALEMLEEKERLVYKAWRMEYRDGLEAMIEIYSNHLPDAYDKLTESESEYDSFADYAAAHDTFVSIRNAIADIRNRFIHSFDVDWYEFLHLIPYSILTRLDY
jgi:hypothetical protein